MTSKCLLRQGHRLLRASHELQTSGRGRFEGLPTTIVKHHSHLAKNEEGKYTCTMIPGDGVGPELVISDFFTKN